MNPCKHGAYNPCPACREEQAEIEDAEAVLEACLEATSHSETLPSWEQAIQEVHSLFPEDDR